MPEAISVVCCRAGRVSERDVPALRSAGGDLSRERLTFSLFLACGVGVWPGQCVDPLFPVQRL